MPNHWKFLRSMISAADLRSELFLSLIDEEGAIICANATMQRSLDLDNPRLHHINFFHLLHPEHSSDFREAVRRSRATQKPAAAELYLKNGYYHPMKWQVNHVEDQGSGLSGFLCIGYKLVDDQRIQHDVDGEPFLGFEHQPPKAPIRGGEQFGADDGHPGAAKR